MSNNRVSGAVVLYNIYLTSELTSLGIPDLYYRQLDSAPFQIPHPHPRGDSGPLKGL